MTIADDLVLATSAAVAGLHILQRDQSPPTEGPGRGEENTYGLPNGRPIRTRLKRWFKLQRQRVLEQLPTTHLITNFESLQQYTDPMAQDMTPVITAYWDREGKQARARVGLDPNSWRVSDPHLRGKIWQASMRFCQETNNTTKLDLNQALHKLREELAEGIVDEGESIDELTKRVKGVFQDASTWRARRIAATEASSAVHEARLQSAIDSGVVVGKELLISANSCPLCRMIATEARMVRLNQPFAVIGSNPDYATRHVPPLHPGCRCTWLEVLSEVAGGPQNPDFSPTLIQPKPGPDYKPPAGKRVPRPEPERIKRKKVAAST